MKNRFFLMILAGILLFSVSSVAGAKAYLKVGLEPSGNLSKEFTPIDGYDLTTHTSQEVTSGISLSGEYLKSTDHMLAVGGGLEYQFYRHASDDNQKFSYTPVYFLIRTDLPASSQTRPYLIGKVGYNLYNEANPVDSFTLSGGMYYSLGAGVILQKNLVVDLIYSHSTSETRSESLNLAVRHDYTKYTMSMGYRF